MPPEEWRHVPGWPDYEVSSTGRLRRNGREVKCQIAGSGYRQAHLRTGHTSYGPNLSRLICLAFHGPPPTDRHQAAHTNGDRLDDRAENIRWVSPAENAADKRRHGTPKWKLTEEKATAIRRRVAAGEKQAALAHEFGVSPSHVSHIMRGAFWRSPTPSPPAPHPSGDSQQGPGGAFSVRG